MSNWFMRGFMVLVAVLMVLGIYSYIHDTNACEARGGQPIYLKGSGVICLKKDGILQ